MSHVAPAELVFPSEAVKGAEAVKALGVISAAHSQGGESARRTIQVQTDALEKALNANSTLVEQVVEMAKVVRSSAEQTAEVAKIAAQRDVEVARVASDKEFEGRLFELAQGPVGQALLTKLGVLPSVDPKAKEGAKRVMARLLAREDWCEELRKDNSEDWAGFIAFVDAM